MKISELWWAAGLIAAVPVAAAILWRRYRVKSDPERKRRDLISHTGRIVEGVVLDYNDGLVLYSWSWRGVTYEATQDLRGFQNRLPEKSELLIGPVSVRFLPRDPSSSIVFSETWNGFRFSREGRTSV